jgi:hypothetical protein
LAEIKKDAIGSDKKIRQIALSEKGGKHKTGDTLWSEYQILQ